ncbi:MAG: CARDB domain-containing protein, partial [bacterium]
MKQLQFLSVIIVLLTMTVSLTWAQQGVPLAKIRVDEDGNVQVLNQTGNENKEDQKSIESREKLYQETQPALSENGPLSNSASLPDLTYIDSKYTFTEPDLTIYVKIKNIGNNKANENYVKFYLSNDKFITTEDQYIGRKYVNALKPDEELTISFNKEYYYGDRYICGDSWYVGFIIDYQNTVTESNEDNNTGFIGPPLEGGECLPDLYPEALYINDFTGPEIEYNIVLLNRGGVITENSFDNYIYLSTDTQINHFEDYWINTWTSPPIDVDCYHQSGFICTTINGVPAGDYYLGIRVDANNVIEEFDEDNNTRYSSDGKIIVTTHPATKPDLKVTEVSVTDHQGPQIEYQYSVKNQSNASTGSAFKNYIYLSTDQTITQSDYKIDEQQCSALGAGATHNSGTVQTTVSGVPAGDYYLGVYADGAKVISESNENNNTGYDNSPKVNISGGSGEPEEPEEPEEPAGNMISNWSFNDDMTDWTFNTSESGNAQGKVEKGVFHAQITNGGGNVWNVSLYQYNLNIIKGNTYTVSFNAKADSPRDILSAIAMSVSPFWLYNFDPEFSLTTDWQTYTYTFTMGFDTDPAARLGFDFGTSDTDVYLDHISCVEISGTAIETPEPSTLVRSFQLFQNFPNPFNPITTIRYQIAEPGFVSLKIYDLLGKEVDTLVQEEMAA